MRKLVMIGIVALSCAALAQEPEGQKVGPKGELGRRPMMSERGRMPMGGGMNGGMMGNDQAIMAVMNPDVAEKLGIDDATQLKIKEIDLNLRKLNRELQKKTREAKEKQAKLMKEAKVDEAAVMSAIDELFDLRKEMAKTQTKRVIAVKALLTSEQLEKAVEELRKVREEKRRGMRGKDDQPPPPPPAED